MFIKKKKDSNGVKVDQFINIENLFN